MDEQLRHQRDTSLGQLAALIERGRAIRDTRSVDATRDWQRDCAAAVNQLSGGSKAHWLSRAYSGAFLVRAADGGVVVQADSTEIVDRILDVLAQGAALLSRMDEVEAASTTAAPRPRRFDFVHEAELRPVLEQAFDDSRHALERGESGLALILSAGVIEAVITDALQGCGPRTADGGSIADLSFEARISAAEKEGLIRSGCARLPAQARSYRELTDADGQLRSGVTVSERDARITSQVLHVVMRDLNPGR
jgi:vacuolar-type H+-ATPase subunit E/Vma4